MENVCAVLLCVKIKNQKYVQSEYNCVRNMHLLGQKQENEYAK